MRWSISFFALLVRIQWIDRRATSSFVVGITIQIAILSLGITQLSAAGVAAVLQAALRAGLLVGLAVCSLSGMSAFQNEFRFQTIWQTARDPRVLRRLLLARAFAMVVITMPALCVPFLVALVVVGRLDVVPGALVILLALAVILTAYTHLLTLVLAITYDPARIVPWIRQLTMAVLVGTVAFISPKPVRQLFPFHWLEEFAREFSPVPLAWTLATVAAWWIGGVLILRRPSAAILEARLMDNVEAR